jgi:hypothetical protein
MFESIDFKQMNDVQVMQLIYNKQILTIHKRDSSWPALDRMFLVFQNWIIRVGQLFNW